MNIDYLKNKNIHFIECEDWNNVYGYEKTQMKEDTINYIEQLQQENQELKEQNKKEFADYIKFKKEQYDEYLEKVNKLIKENQELKKQVKKLKRKIRKLKNKNYDKQDEFVIYLQKKKYDYAGANFPKDDLFDEVQEILVKYNEVTGVFDRWEKEASNALDKDIENFIKEFYDLMQKATN